MDIQLITNASPKQQERFKEWVLSRKYPFEGRVRKGYNRPFISETKLWTIKLKKECVEPFLSELKGSTQEIGSAEGEHRPVQKTINRTMKWMVKIINLIARPKLGHDKIMTWDMTKIPAGGDTLGGWIYSKVLFGVNDATTPDGQEMI